MSNNELCGSYDRNGGRMGVSPKREPSSPSDLNHPLLRLNRTVSENSSEGNAIDMVRLERRKQQGRITKINTYRQFYNKYTYGNNPNRYHPGINNIKDELAYPPQGEIYGNKNPRQQSPSDRFVLESSQRNYFRSTFRPSQMNLLQEMDGSARNKVIGWLLMVVFIIIYLQFVILCGVVLNEGYLSQVSNEPSIPFEPNSLFTTALFLYSLSQCLYHLTVYIIHSKTNNRIESSSPLIDTEAASWRYLLRCREFSSQPSSFMQRVIKSPKFTILIIIISTILLTYGTVECFYHSQVMLMYSNQSYAQQGNSLLLLMCSLFQLAFYVIIMPDAMSFVFFQQMHIAHNNNNNNNHQRNSDNNANSNYDQTNIVTTTPFNINQNNLSQQLVNNHYDTKQDSFTVPPLTVFNINSWWVKMLLVVLLIAIVYSLLSGKWWLAIMAFAKLELCFVKNKYRIDLFWMQLVTKVGIVVVTGLLLLYDWHHLVISQSSSNQELTSPSTSYNNLGYNNVSPFISFSKLFSSTVTITISLLLSRVLAAHYLRDQLYKHLFQQMQIITNTTIGSLLIICILYQYILSTITINYISVLIIILMQTGLFISVCIEGKKRQQIDLLALRDDLSENCQIQMQRYQI